MANYIEISENENIGFVTINRPSKLNAFNTKLMRELSGKLARISTREDIRVVVLQSAGKRAFIAGADIAEMSGLDQIGLRNYTDNNILVWETIENLKQPVIAKVSGYAYGGGCLTALSCDIVIASENASFGQQEINLGILGGPAVLPRIVGRYKAAEIVMLGEAFDVKEAYRIGMVNKVVADEKLDETVLETARRIASKPKLALQMAKNALRIGYNEHVQVARRYERDLSCLAFGDEEGKKKMEAFLNRGKK